MEIEEEQTLAPPVGSDELEPVSLDTLGDGKLREEKPDLDGKQVVIGNVLLLPKEEERTTRDGQHTYRDILVRLVYQNGEAEVFEHLGGLKQFKHGEQWGEATFKADGNSQLAALFRLWLKKTGMQPEDVSVKSFLQGLIGVSCVLACRTVEYEGRAYRKNLIEAFV